VYDQPASLFVNQFVGAANQLTGTLGSASGGATATLDVGTTMAVRTPTPGLANGAPILVCIRPEHLRLSDTNPPDGDPRIKGTIELSLPLGPQIIHEVRLENGAAVKVVEARGEGARSREPGSAVVLLLKPGATVSAFPLNPS
jgi:putative spermidine/putrescine transport system ATP-binding protein